MARPLVSNELWGLIEPLIPKVKRRYRYPGPSSPVSREASERWSTSSSTTISRRARPPRRSATRSTASSGATDRTVCEGSRPKRLPSRLTSACPPDCRRLRVGAFERSDSGHGECDNSRSESRHPVRTAEIELEGGEHGACCRSALGPLPPGTQGPAQRHLRQELGGRRRRRGRIARALSAQATLSRAAARRRLHREADGFDPADELANALPHLGPEVRRRSACQLRVRLPVVLAGAHLPGIAGSHRLLAGIPVRDERGMAESRRSSAPRQTTGTG